MKTITKALIASGLAILVILGFPILQFVYGMALWSYYDHKQMNTAKKYMDSLTDKDIQTWIQRTQKYLTEYPPTNFDVGLDSNSVPPDLQQLGIIDIEEQSNEVDYMWLAGIDGTALVVQTNNGNFKVTAVYTPYSYRVIWPKQ